MRFCNTHLAKEWHYLVAANSVAHLERTRASGSQLKLLACHARVRVSVSAAKAANANDHIRLMAQYTWEWPLLHSPCMCYMPDHVADGTRVVATVKSIHLTSGCMSANTYTDGYRIMKSASVMQAKQCTMQPVHLQKLAMDKSGGWGQHDRLGEGLTLKRS